MKKMLVLIGILAMISVSSFADQSCPVRGTDGVVASLQYSDKKCMKDGELYIPISLSAPSKGETTVMVEVRDSEGRMLGTAALVICDGCRTNEQGSCSSKNNKYCNENLKSGKFYSLDIAKASCSW